MKKIGAQKALEETNEAIGKTNKYQY